MNHRLLILGTLGEFVQLVQRAKAKGIYTIVCDSYPDGPARAYADEAYTIPVTDIQAIADLCIQRKVDGIITSFSDLLLECMVKIADLAGLPCYLQPEQLIWYRDKAATRALLKELGLPSPGFQIIHPSDPQEIEDLSSHLSFPVLTKPVDKYGSRGIYVVEKMEDLPEAVQKTAHFSNLDHILVEEYDDGYEFNMMTWVLDGKVHVISIADREKTQIAKGEIPISTRNVYPSRLYDLVESSATKLLTEYISRTGQKNGALSMQFFWNPDRGIRVCEIAARFFGYEHELTDMVYGFNIEELLLNSLYDPQKLKEMLQTHHPKNSQCHGAVLYFQGRLLQIGDQSIARQLSSHPCVVKPWIFYHDGETVIEHGPNPYLALYYIQAETRHNLDDYTKEFFETMSILDPNGQEVAYRNQIPNYPGESI